MSFVTVIRISGFVSNLQKLDSSVLIITEGTIHGGYFISFLLCVLESLMFNSCSMLSILF